MNSGLVSQTLHTFSFKMKQIKSLADARFFFLKEKIPLGPVPRRKEKTTLTV